MRQDLETHINKIVPENMACDLQKYERLDDMPAHIKASLPGNNFTIPIICGALSLGMWQGIILGEHRVKAGSRHLITTIYGK